MPQEHVNDFFWQIGGNWNDPKLSDAQKADIAANAERVLKYIDQTGGQHSTANNNMIEGSIWYGFRIHRGDPDTMNKAGSEARALLNFSKEGYSALQDPNTGKLLPTTPPVVKKEPPVRAELDTAKLPTAEDRRPSEDTRTAKDIYSQSQALQLYIGKHNDLTPAEEAVRENLLTALKGVVGNFGSNNPDKEAQADALFRLAKAAEFILAKSDGVERTAKERFVAFSQNGYASLKEDLPLPGDGASMASNTEENTTNKPTHPGGRPSGDTRNADQILSANRAITDFLQQLQGKSYGRVVISGLKTQVGDWTPNNKDLEKRADAAYNLSQLAHYVMGHIPDEYTTFGYYNIEPKRIAGLPDTGVPRGKTQATALLVFSHKGYASLPD